MKLGLIDEEGSIISDTGHPEQKTCPACNLIIKPFTPQIQVPYNSSFRTYHKDCYEK